MTWVNPTPTPINKAEALIINGEVQMLFDWDYEHLNNLPTLWTAASKDVGISAWNVPILDANWKLDSSIVPSTWVMTSYTVTNKSDLTTLTTAVKWDIWIVTSENKTYILSNDPYSTLSNWTELLFPTGSVSSVNWFTWAVNLTTGYIQESNNNLFVSPTEKATWNNKLWANNVSTVALTGNYGDLNNKPVIDTTLNNSSTNAVQNKAIATAVNNINSSITSIQGDISSLEWDTNTKTFYLQSDNDLTTAQAAYDWWVAWNNPILKFKYDPYFPNGDAKKYAFTIDESSTAGEVTFYACQMGTAYWINRSSLTRMKVVFSASNGAVTWFTISSPNVIRYLDTWVTYTSSFIPEHDYQPATKKYVDDELVAKQGTLVSGTNIKTINNESLLGSGNIDINSVNWLKFQVITQSAYTALNGTYAANTVYLIKQG